MTASRYRRGAVQRRQSRATSASCDFAPRVTRGGQPAFRPCAGGSAGPGGPAPSATASGRPPKLTRPEVAEISSATPAAVSAERCWRAVFRMHDCERAGAPESWWICFMDIAFTVRCCISPRCTGRFFFGDGEPENASGGSSKHSGLTRGRPGRARRVVALVAPLPLGERRRDGLNQGFQPLCVPGEPTRQPPLARRCHAL